MRQITLVALLLMLAALSAGCATGGLGRVNNAHVVPLDTQACSLVSADEVGAAIGASVSAEPHEVSSEDSDQVRGSACRYRTTDGTAAFGEIALLIGPKADIASATYNISRGPLRTRNRKDVPGLGDGAFYNVDKHILDVLHYNAIVLVGVVPASDDMTEATLMPIDESLARTAIGTLDRMAAAGGAARG